MKYFPLDVYQIDMKYIRNLHKIDDRVLSVSPQTGKDERPFLGVIIICNEYKYCVPMSKPKKKHEKMRNKIDFKKIECEGELIGVLNFNLMIPVEEVLIRKIDTRIHKHDNHDTKKKKELLQKELLWCNEHFRDLINTANVLYTKYLSGEEFSSRKQCLDFKRMEFECKKYVDKLLCNNIQKNNFIYEIEKRIMNMTRPEYDMEAMGRRMKYYRKQKNLSVEDVREYMQFSSVQAIYKWESGKCFPSADNLVALAELYQVNPLDIMPKRLGYTEGNFTKKIKFIIELCNRNKMDYLVFV